MQRKDCSLARILLITGTLAGIVLAVTPSQAQNDPPPGSARLANLRGNVSIQPSGVDGWGQAYPNQPAGPGDRIYTDQQSEGELQAAQVRAYFSPNSDLTLVDLGYQGVALGIAQGSAFVYSDGFPSGQQLAVQTPNGAITISGGAGFRVDVYPDQQSTVITNGPRWGVLTITGQTMISCTGPGLLSRIVSTPFPPVTFRPRCLATMSWTHPVTGSLSPITARSGFLASKPAGRRITMDIGSISPSMAGAGSRTNPGVLRPSTMAAGWSSEAAGDGFPVPAKVIPYGRRHKSCLPEGFSSEE
jgi:hypothetical protein